MHASMNVGKKNPVGENEECGQVNTSRLDVTASPTAKPATGKSQSCQQPVVVVATRRRAVSVIVIAEMSFCDVSHTQRLCNDGRPPTLYVLNAAAITKAHAIEHLGADLVITVITDTPEEQTC